MERKAINTLRLAELMFVSAKFCELLNLSENSFCVYEPKVWNITV